MEFRKLRRQDRLMADEEAVKLLKEGEYGFLATSGADGMPYVTPVNYIYDNGCIYFHCAKEGHKLDNIMYNKNASFAVVADTCIISEKQTTLYKSVITFGQCSIVPDDENKKPLLGLVEKYTPEAYSKTAADIDNIRNNVLVVKLEVLHITGKENKI